MGLSHLPWLEYRILDHTCQVVNYSITEKQPGKHYSEFIENIHALTSKYLKLGGGIMYSI